MKITALSFNNLKHLISSYFILIGLMSLIETLSIKPNYYLRDLIILMILSLPLIINKRLFYFFFGLFASIISLVLLMVFIAKNNPTKIDVTIPMFILGCLFFTITLICSLLFIYIGTYTSHKNSFRLV